MLIIVRSFSYTSLAGSAIIFSFSSCHIQTGHTFFLYCSCNADTDAIPDVMLRPNKDARARSDRLQLGTAHIQSSTQTRQVSVVMGMTRFWLLSALSECNACLGRGSHRHASSGFVSVQTRSTAQSWHDLVRTSVFPFILIEPLIRSFSYTPRAGFRKEFHLHSSNLFKWGVSLTLL